MDPGGTRRPVGTHRSQPALTDLVWAGRSGQRAPPRPGGSTGSSLCLDHRVRCRSCNTACGRQFSQLTNFKNGAPARFSAGPLEGYVIRQADTVEALSAMCTHMACLLTWSRLRARFECPCHGATFSVSGRPLGGRWPGRAPLPRIDVRVQAGQVEDYTVESASVGAGSSSVPVLARVATWPAI